MQRFHPYASCERATGAGGGGRTGILTFLYCPIQLRVSAETPSLVLAPWSRIPSLHKGKLRSRTDTEGLCQPLLASPGGTSAGRQHETCLPDTLPILYCLWGSSKASASQSLGHPEALHLLKAPFSRGPPPQWRFHHLTAAVFIFPSHH